MCHIKSKLELALMGAYMRTGNEPVDEDVDIGGDDPPISSYPSVERGKDAMHKSSKCSSSSSSSSYSGSSSSGLFLFP